jgi:tetratricopeptide (TPR) repeat protein
MRVRFGATAALAFALALGGCASAGNGPSVSTGFGAPEDLPDWVAELPEGTEPRDNDHTGQATLALLQGNFEEALESARAGIEEDPENPQSYFQAGEALLGMGELEQAAEMLDRAEEIYPRYILETMGLREQAWIDEYNLAFEAIEAEDDAAAVRQFERAHSIYQNRPEAMLNLASIYAQEGQDDRAIDYFSQAIEVIEGPWTERVDDDTRENWMESLEVAQFNKAQLLLRTERYAEAAEAFEVLVERDPDNMDLLSTYAAALVAGGQADRAEALFEELLQRPDPSPADYFSIGVGLYQVDEFEGAAQAFQAVLDEIPEHRDAALNLAQTLYLSEEWEGLERVSQHLADIDPYNENAYRFQAQALVRLDREQDAVQVLDRLEALPWIIDDLSLQAAGQDLVVVGQVTNRTEAEGTAVNLRFHFFDAEGNAAGTADSSIQLPGADESGVFQVEAPAANVFGFRYEVR